MNTQVKPVPDGYHTVTPYLIVEDADALLRFVENAFGASVLARHAGPEGRVMHAEFQIGDSRIMLGESNEEFAPMPVMLHLYVDDVDGTYRRAVEAGAAPVREPETMFYGDRSGGVRDPLGNRWWIATRVEEVSPEEVERRQAAQRGAQ